MRDSFILSKEYNLIAILTVLKAEEPKRLTNTDIAQKTNLRGGSLTACITDLKNMKLVDNGYGIGINDDGKMFLQRDSETRKQYYLKVPLFNQMHTNNVSNFNSAKQYVEKQLSDHYGKNSIKYAKTIARRYLEAIFSQKIGRQRRGKDTLTPDNMTLEKYLSIKPQIEEFRKLEEYFKQLKQTYGIEPLRKLLEES